MLLNKLRNTLERERRLPLSEVARLVGTTANGALLLLQPWINRGRARLTTTQSGRQRGCGTLCGDVRWVEWEDGQWRPEQRPPG